MRVEWSLDARADQQRIWLFLAERDPDRADRVEARIEERARTLATFPAMGRRVADGIRRLSVTDVQYVVDYEIKDEEQLIRILRVRSTREDRTEP